LQFCDSLPSLEEENKTEKKKKKKKKKQKSETEGVTLIAKFVLANLHVFSELLPPEVSATDQSKEPDLKRRMAAIRLAKMVPPTFANMVQKALAGTDGNGEGVSKGMIITYTGHVLKMSALWRKEH
jgi:hypothetical protein